MKKKKQSGNAKRAVLRDYKKVGTTFVPPMVHQIGPWQYTSWSSQTMPELIWWDVLIDKISHRFATKAAEEIAKYFKAKGEHKCWWGFISDYAQPGADDVDGLKDHLRHTSVLAALTEGLAEFVNLYPACPISRLLDQPPTGIVDLGYLQHFEDRVRGLEDKRSRSSVLVQAQPVYMGFVLGRLFVKEGLALAELPEVERYPATEISRHVGASVCAAVNMLAGTMLPKFPEDAWVQYFWQRSVELRPLDFAHLETQ